MSNTMTGRHLTLLSPIAHLRFEENKEQDEGQIERMKEKEIGRDGEIAAVPHCDFTLGWLEQSVEGLASISLQTRTGGE